MSNAPRDTVTRLLAQAAEGDRPSAEKLLPLVYDELRRLAGACFQNERANHTLQPTAIVHDAFMKLVDHDGIEWESRRQFYALASRAMRNVLVDHARGRNRLKRGGGAQNVVTLEAVDQGSDTDVIDVVALDDALQRLAQLDEQRAKLVELRYFGGLTLEEAAQQLGVARSTASESWRLARAWLYRELKGGDA